LNSWASSTASGLDADAEDEERADGPFPADQPAQVLAEETGQEGQRQEDGGDDGQLLHHVVELAAVLGLLMLFRRRGWI
jgi:hypothetical protein